MSTRWKTRLVIGVASVGVFVLIGVFAIQYVQGSALREFHDGEA